MLVGVCVDVLVEVFVGVLVGVCVDVLVGVFVGVSVNVLVGVFVGVGIGVAVNNGVGVGAVAQHPIRVAENWSYELGEIPQIITVSPVPINIES